MITTRYILLKKDLELMLQQQIEVWEAEHTPLRAVVVGCYQSSTLTQLTGHKLLGGRIDETIQVPFENTILEVYGFCLVADSNQLPNEVWEQLAVIGKVFDTRSIQRI
jgi:hypothetical protein